MDQFPKLYVLSGGEEEALHQMMVRFRLWEVQEQAKLIYGPRSQRAAILGEGVRPEGHRRALGVLRMF